MITKPFANSIRHCFIIVFFLLFSSLKGFSQTKIDSLIQNLDYIKDDQKRLTALKKLTSKMVNENHEDQLKYLQECVALAKKLEDYDLMAWKARFIIYQYVNTDKPEKALELIDEMLSYKDKFKDEASKAYMWLKKGGLYFANLDFKNAIEHYNKAALTFEKTRDSAFAGDAYFFSGQANARIGNLTEAIFKFEKAYPIYEAIKDYDYVFFTKNELYLMYRKNRLVEEAEKVANELIVLCEREKKITRLAYLKLNLAMVEIERNNFTKAKPYLEYAGKTYKKLEKEKFKNNYEGMGEYYYYNATALMYHSKLNQLDSAKMYFDKIKEIEEQAFNNKSISTQVLKHKSIYFEKTNQLDKALELLTTYKDHKKSNKVVLSNDDINVEHIFVDIYKKQGNVEKVNYHLDHLIRYKDSLNAMTTTNTYAYHSSRFRTEQKEKEIIKQAAEIQKLESDKAISAGKRNTLLALLLSALLIASGIWWMGKTKRKQLALEIKKNREDLSNFTKQLLQKSVEQEALQHQLEQLKLENIGTAVVDNLHNLLSTKILTTQDWLDFKIKFNAVHPYFLKKIKDKGYQLTNAEERLIALEKLELSSHEIANMLGISFSSVVQYRYRIRKKMSAPAEISIIDFIEKTI